MPRAHSVSVVLLNELCVGGVNERQLWVLLASGEAGRSTGSWVSAVGVVARTWRLERPGPSTQLRLSGGGSPEPLNIRPTRLIQLLRVG